LTRLTNAHLRYLKDHGIEPEEAFDASGLKRAEYRARMKAEGKFVAYGVTPCLNGHALRNRYGNCIQCSPAAIAFARRSELAGYLYLAQSSDLGLIKVGFSSDDPDNRIYIANLDGYGGTWDWRIYMTVWADHAGAKEIAVHQSLFDFRVERAWVRNGAAVVSKEMFDCDLAVALGALSAHLTARERKTIEYR
jgi:hypothetical protein